MSERDRELLGQLLEAGRQSPPTPSDLQSRAGWSRLQRALPAVVVMPQIDVPPAAIETAVVGKAVGIGKLFGMASGVGWAGKAIVAGVLATTIGTVGVIATRPDARRDTPARELATVAPRADESPSVVPAIVPATPPTIVPAIPPSTGTARAELASEPRVRGGKDARVRSTPLPPAPLPTTTVRPSALDSQSALIDAAHRALAAKDLHGALERLDDHAARYPAGSMAEDREALRVVVLCRLGRTQAAARVRDAFFQRWPESMHSARVRGACSDPAVDP